jgi:hypothetical protein
MAPPASEGKGHGGTLNPGPLKDAIDRDFGSLENLQKEFNATTAAIQGSGWGWLVSKFSFSGSPPDRVETVGPEPRYQTSPNRDHSQSRSPPRLRPHHRG